MIGNKLFLAIFLTIVLTGCSGSVQSVNKITPSGNTDSIKEMSAITPPTFEDYSISDPGQRDLQTFCRYQLTIVDSITNYYKVYGKMPVSLEEFFQSDLCLIFPIESTTGKPFVSSSTLDQNHPEYLVYKYIDSNTAELKMLQILKNSEPRIFINEWTNEKFLSGIPMEIQPDFNKLPLHKKNMVMADQIASLFQYALANYFDENGVFPDNLDALFEKWGALRREPWKNYEYDDPVMKVRNEIFGFDRIRNVYCVHHMWIDGDSEIAFQFPANFIAEQDRPLNMRQVENIDTLNVEFFADIETLKNLP